LILHQIHNIALTKNYIVDFEHLEVVERRHVLSVGTKGVSKLYHLSFDDNKVLKIINWIC